MAASGDSSLTQEMCDAFMVFASYRAWELMHKGLVADKDIEALTRTAKRWLYMIGDPSGCMSKEEATQKRIYESHMAFARFAEKMAFSHDPTAFRDVFSYTLKRLRCGPLYFIKVCADWFEVLRPAKDPALGLRFNTALLWYGRAMNQLHWEKFIDLGNLLRVYSKGSEDGDKHGRVWRHFDQKFRLDPEWQKSAQNDVETQRMHTQLEEFADHWEARNFADVEDACFIEFATTMSWDVLKFHNAAKTATTCKGREHEIEESAKRCSAAYEIHQRRKKALQESHKRPSKE